jgi:hypothetical protein
MEYQDRDTTGHDVTSTSLNAHNSACCGVPLQDYHEHMADIDRSHAVFLAQARKKAAASNRRSKSKLATSSSTDSRKSSLEKARRKSYKRKQDIFRKSTESSSSSSFSNFFLGNAAFPQVLCFANPIFDSEDNEQKLREGDDLTVDDETITSTLYFDARYEHLEENQQPIPLYHEFRVMQTGSDHDIINIFYGHSHKTISSVYCEKPPPPPGPTSSVMDDTSSSEESSDESTHRLFYQRTFLVEQADETQNASCIPSPPMCRSRNELGVIEDIIRRDDLPPGLKLISKSSNSSAALTPACSSKSNTSQSPNVENSKLKHIKVQAQKDEMEKRMRAIEDFRISNRYT